MSGTHGLPSRDVIVRWLTVGYGVAPDAAERAADRIVTTHSAGIVDPIEFAVQQHTAPLGAAEDRARAHAIETGQLPSVLRLHSRTLGDQLRLVLELPPRTKKNHGRGVAKQSAAYVRYRQQIVDSLAVLRLQYGTPVLPDRAYNLAATYYVDRPGERADRPGLDQALFDVLQDAGIVSDDWYFRTTDGTRIVVGDARPRVEIIITPIED